MGQVAATGDSAHDEYRPYGGHGPFSARSRHGDAAAKTREGAATRGLTELPD